LGINLSDYGARYYDASIARFTTIDPKAEVYDAWSPYHYAANNPVKYIDINGEGWGVIVKAVKTAVKAGRKYLKARKSGKKFSPKKFIKEEGVGIIDDAMTLTDGEINLDDAKAAADLILGTDLNDPKKKAADKAKKKYSKKEARQKAKEKKEQQPASEDYVKYKARELEKSKGKDARRKAHDKKRSGAPDRTKKQIDKDYNGG
jgi:uncharacterized protein RhaS with RHS repeats